MLDAGPLIALLHGSDPDHANAAAGFRQLVTARAHLIAPLPIVFEVFKWLVYEGGPTVARIGLIRLRQSVEIMYPVEADLETVTAIVAALPAWSGTLEDALVAATGLRWAAPVWTLNYRDLSAFGKLEFWTPLPE